MLMFNELGLPMPVGNRHYITSESRNSGPRNLVRKI